MMAISGCLAEQTGQTPAAIYIQQARNPQQQQATGLPPSFAPWTMYSSVQHVQKMYQHFTMYSMYVKEQISMSTSQHRR